MNHLKTTFRLFLTSTLLALPACREKKTETPAAHPTLPPPQAEKVVVSMEEMQDILGIMAWRVRIPPDFGEHPWILYEQYTDGKRVAILEHGFQRDTREALIAFRKEGDFYYYRYEFKGASGSSVSAGSHQILPEPLKGDDSPSSSTRRDPKVRDNEIVLLRVSYSKRDPDGSYRSGFGIKPATEVILRIAKDREPIDIK